MKAKRSWWTSLSGSLASVAPVLFSVCKGGACVGVCVSPLAPLFGISSAAVASSPIVSAIEPLLIAISAVSFTVSYYSLYVLPKLNCSSSENCSCEETGKTKRQLRINKAIFWIGLVLSLGFLGYFEITKYQSAISEHVESSVDACAPGECSESADGAGTGVVAGDDSAFSCCEKTNEISSRKSTITCPGCGHQKTEIMPTEFCLLSYSCENCYMSMHPKGDDCCVFCTYGDHKCPSKQ